MKKNNKFMKARVPKHISMSMHHNFHNRKKLTVQQCIDKKLNGYEKDDWISKEQKQKAIETGNHWFVMVFPRSSEIYYVYSASDLDILLFYLSELEDWPEAT